MVITHGMNLRAALRTWIDLQGTIDIYPGIGELKLTHPALDRPLRINGRRKDSPRAVTKQLMYLASLVA